MSVSVSTVLFWQWGKHKWPARHICRCVKVTDSLLAWGRRADKKEEAVVWRGLVQCEDTLHMHSANTEQMGGQPLGRGHGGDACVPYENGGCTNQESLRAWPIFCGQSYLLVPKTLIRTMRYTIPLWAFTVGFDTKSRAIYGQVDDGLNVGNVKMRR